MRTFFVFFRFGSAELDDVAREDIRAAAAEAAKAAEDYHVWVTGHADTVGDREFNFGLSRRRADVIREALLSAGVDAAVITTEAFGSECPLVRRPAGTPEPLNRRAEILLAKGSVEILPMECGGR